MNLAGSFQKKPVFSTFFLTKEQKAV